jgi:hypothetical protein
LAGARTGNEPAARIGWSTEVDRNHQKFITGMPQNGFVKKPASHWCFGDLAGVSASRPCAALLMNTDMLAPTGYSGPGIIDFDDFREIPGFAASRANGSRRKEVHRLQTMRIKP